MKKTKKYKKPNAIIYSFFYIISKIICFFKLSLKIGKNEVKGKKGGFVIIANHGSSIDFMPLCVALKRRAHFVISNAFYSSLHIQPLLNSVGVIPKNQFQTSVSEMRAMKSVLENEMPLVLYPAGLMYKSRRGGEIADLEDAVHALENRIRRMRESENRCTDTLSRYLSRSAGKQRGRQGFAFRRG